LSPSCNFRRFRDPGLEWFAHQGDVEHREIVTYTRELIRTNRVDQAAFDVVLKRHGVQWLVELTAAANYYGLLCGIVNAFEVPAPPDGDKLPA
jgi:hypothetical protein